MGVSTKTDQNDLIFVWFGGYPRALKPRNIPCCFSIACCDCAAPACGRGYRGAKPWAWNQISQWYSKHFRVNKSWLVGGFNPSEKYESVGMMKFPMYGKIKKCSKPPTRYWFDVLSSRKKEISIWSAVLNSIERNAKSSGHPLCPDWNPVVRRAGMSNFLNPWLPGFCHVNGRVDCMPAFGGSSNLDLLL